MQLRRRRADRTAQSRASFAVPQPPSARQGRAARALLRRLLGRRLPVTEGHLEVEGAQGAVHIRRDCFDIPYIEAESENDVWYGLGFCHGQDRCVQTDLLRRAATGTLAEILGRPALNADRFARRVGFRRVAEQQWAVLNASHQRRVQAYARGLSE